MIIYAIKRKTDSKIVYIGQTTKTLNDRKQRHYRAAKTQDTILCRAFKKHGIDNFDFSILENSITSREELNNREKYWIKFYGTYPPSSGAYNMTDGGNFTEFSDEYKLKLRTAQLKRYENDEERLKTSVTSKLMYENNPELINMRREQNKKRYEDIGERIKTGKAVKASFDKHPEMKRKIGEATRQRYIDNPELRLEQSYKAKNLACYINGRQRAHAAVRRKVVCVESGEVFDSIINAARKMMVRGPSISKALKRGTTCKGVHWRYYE